MKRWYPVILYMFGLGLLLLNTMPTDYLLGTDYHLEYYFAQQAMNGWDSGITHPGNAALGVTLMAPAIVNVFNVPLEMVFKVIYPAIFATVPVILYYLYSRYITKSEAFISAIFLILVPTFMMEIAGIGKQQVAEVFMVLTLLVMLSGIRSRVQIPLILILVLCTIVSHYSTGVVLLLVMMLYGCYLFGYERISKIPQWAKRQTVTIKASIVALCFVMSLMMGIVYWGWAAGGTPLRYMTHLIPIEETKVGPYYIGRIPPEKMLTASGGSARIMDLTAQEYDILMRVAIGLDFPDVPWEGKVFRVIQYITQIGLVVGVIYTLRTRRIKKSYKALLLVASTIMALCLIFPVFSAVLNATRWYHMALLIAAPALVLAFTRVIRKPLLLVALLVVYGAFTTGVVFEVMRIGEIERPNIPYSMGLSGQRLDIAGNLTRDDENSRIWIKSQPTRDVYSDIQGLLFLQETMALDKKFHILKGADAIDNGALVFLRARNTETKSITTYNGIGSRISRPLETNGMTMRFASGNSRVMMQHGE